MIRRNVLENPGWYTAYTPYQAEIAQGRLEALLNFQTMVCDLTGMEMANASLLDEATAAAEAMTMLFNSRSRKAVKEGVNRFVASDEVFPQTWAVLQNRAHHLGIQIEQRPESDLGLDGQTFGLFIQYPSDKGRVEPLNETIAKAHALDIRVVVATDLLACALVKSPGEMGADVVVGNSQRFGVPMGYGGPHAAFFATRLEFKRNVPGRVIGASVDRMGRVAYRMALQTREQHIRRDKATSNICTAQSLLAVMASSYAVYHGPKGLRAIAERVHALAVALAEAGKAAGILPVHGRFFDTVVFAMEDVGSVIERAERKEINLRYFPDGVHVGISFHECTLPQDFTDLCEVLGFSKRALSHPGECHRPVGRSAAFSGLLAPSCIQQPSLGDGDDAVFEAPREQRPVFDPCHDSLGVVYHEAECGDAIVAHRLGLICPTPSVLSSCSSRGNQTDDRRARTIPLRNHGIFGHEPAAQQWCTGRIHWIVGDPCFPRLTWGVSPGCLF